MITSKCKYFSYKVKLKFVLQPCLLLLLSQFSFSQENHYKAISSFAKQNSQTQSVPLISDLEGENSIICKINLKSNSKSAYILLSDFDRDLLHQELTSNSSKITLVIIGSVSRINQALARLRIYTNDNNLQFGISINYFKCPSNYVYSLKDDCFYQVLSGVIAYDNKIKISNSKTNLFTYKY